MERQPKLLYAMAYKMITEVWNSTLFNDDEVPSPMSVLSGKTINTVLAPVRMN